LQKNILKEKKKVILLLSVLFILGFALSGCNWFGEGILNVFDPKAYIVINVTEINPTEGTVDLEIYSLNQVRFSGETFSYKYYNNGVLIDHLTKTVGWEFDVQGSDTPGTPGPITEITDLPLYFQDVRSYMTSNPLSTDITCKISLIGTDGASYTITKSVTVNMPIYYFPEINIILTANPASFNSNGGTSTISAYVVDSYSQPVGGLNVIFTTTGGTLSSTYATTGANGSATTILTVPANITEEDITYEVSAYVGVEEGSASVTVKGIPEAIENGTCPSD
jgi:hypothetical protein